MHMYGTCVEYKTPGRVVIDRVLQVEELRRMCACLVLDPLANCIGCIFGSSDPKSILPSVSSPPRSCASFLFQIALQRAP